MVRSKLKGYAGKKGFKVCDGLAFGVHRGYLITLDEDIGIIKVKIAAELSDELPKAELDLYLYEQDVRQRYSLVKCEVTDEMVYASLAFTKDALSRLDGFIEYMCSTLEYMKISGAVFCASCGYQVTGTIDSVIIKDETVEPLHSQCAEKIAREIMDTHKEKTATGSVLTGTIGAILGGIVGAVPWAYAYYSEWVFSWFGLLIGLGAKKGYELFRGKESKAKALVIILVTVFAVVFAQFVAFGVYIYMDYKQEGFIDVSLIGAFRIMLYFFSESRAAFRDFVNSIAKGWLFAALGISSSIRQILAETSVSDGMPIRL